ncbi:hypothetical protein EVAR_76468_1 [Eumeta japonica]|uniref:Uncharacterized protein n=1 Tax=Eumeta variegata TaxID=151549 RepID=A0A4C1T4J6_EUMVA|nr:hypothetical protein EVAR_76468_1 [Eumeta japonica]
MAPTTTPDDGPQEVKPWNGIRTAPLGCLTPSRAPPHPCNDRYIKKMKNFYGDPFTRAPALSAPRTRQQIHNVKMCLSLNKLTFFSDQQRTRFSDKFTE